MLQLLFLFFLVAIVYAMAGFGGGSSYIALMALFELPYELIPPIALLCNLIVVSGGVFHFVRAGHFRWPLFWPFALGSVPLAFLGGRIPIGRTLFLWLLGVSLIAAGLRLFLLRDAAPGAPLAGKPPWWLALLAGAALGLLAGLVGIGGGIFLSPLMLNLRWGRPKQVAATASLFIFCNSIAGLAGQLVKRGGAGDIGAYWPLLLAVLAGGQIGSFVGSTKISHRALRSVTAVLVLAVGLRVVWRLVTSGGS